MQPERRIIFKKVSTYDFSRPSKWSKTLIAFISPPGEMFSVVARGYLLSFPFSMGTHA